MSIYANHADFYDRPVRLNEEELDKAAKVIAGFFTDYRLHEIKELLSNWLEVALTTDNTIFSDPAERSGIWCFHQQLEAFIEAVFAEYKKKENCRLVS